MIIVATEINCQDGDTHYTTTQHRTALKTELCCQNDNRGDVGETLFSRITSLEIMMKSPLKFK